MLDKVNNKSSEIGEDGEAQATSTTSDEATWTHPDDGDRSTAADGQAPDAKTCASPSVEEVKERLRAKRRSGPDRPLARLAHVEEQLEIQSAALTNLSEPPKARPDKNLLVHHLVRTVDTSAASRTLAPKLRSEAVGLYSSLPCEDATDSIFNRIIVATANNVMACNARAIETRNAQAIDINLRHAVKAAKIVIELIEARDRRRGPQPVLVGKLNVEAGGQAIVTAKVESHPEQKRVEEITSRRRGPQRT